MRATDTGILTLCVTDAVLAHVSRHYELVQRDDHTKMRIADPEGFVVWSIRKAIVRARMDVQSSKWWVGEKHIPR